MLKFLQTMMTIMSLMPKIIELVGSIEQAFGKGNGPIKKEVLVDGVTKALEADSKVAEEVDKPKVISILVSFAEGLIASLKKRVTP